MSINQTSEKLGNTKILESITSVKLWLNLFTLIPNFRSDVIFILIASVAVNIFALALPLGLMQIYDRIIPNTSYSTLTLLIVGIIIAIIFETVIKILRSFIANWISARLEHIFNTEALSYFINSNLDRYEHELPGVHFERFNALNTIRSYLAGKFLLILVDIPFSLLFIGLLYYIGGFLCFFTLGIACLYLILVSIAKNNFKKLNDTQTKLQNEDLDFMLEVFDGIHTVKSLNMEDKISRCFENVQGRLSEASLNLNNLKGIPENSLQFLTQLNMLGIIFLGAHLVINSTMTIGAMTACTMFATRGIQPLMKLISFWLKYSELTTAQEEVDKIRELSPKGIAHEAPYVHDISGQICFKNISFKGDYGDTIIDDFSEIIEAGECIGVIGDSPEQTTALMLLLCGLYQPDSGNISVDEFIMSTMDISSFNGRIDYISRKGRLFNGTILENITMFDPGKRSIALNTASLLELDQLVSNLPDGYETQLTQRSNESLPLNIIQRICIARALSTLPRILILDRTINSLDADTLTLMVEIIEAQKGNCTILIVAEHNKFPMKIDRILNCSINK